MSNALIFPELDWKREGAIHRHAPAERAGAFSCLDGEQTEREFVQTIFTLAWATKARRMLETGVAGGLTTRALAQAARLNGGIVTAVEMESRFLREDFFEPEYRDVIRKVQAESLEFLATTNDEFDFVFLDTDLYCRARELELLLERRLLTPGALVCVHDASRFRDEYVHDGSREFWTAFEAMRPRIAAVIEIHLSRGLLILQPLRP